MIVYGDPSSQESFRSRLRRLEESLSVPRGASLDARRGRLIEAGMLEQAVEDGLPGPWAAVCRDLTDACAASFLGVEHYVESLPKAPDVSLTLKVPEGFAFYALYPEGYVVATERWLEERPEPGDVLVVGLRSIGTTLSAVVAEALRRRGVSARRLTVRPTGHPFDRQAEFDPDELRGVDWILVVDEGPGLSGSSMASVAEAAHRAGFPRERIAFLPGHGNPPGPQASDRTQEWWATVPRFFTPTERLRWEGRSLEESLTGATAPPSEVESVEEVGGGRWRAFIYGDEGDWPPIDASFERRKLLVRRKDGTALLWKFTGFANVERNVLGFTSTPWIEGRPLARADFDSRVLNALACHLVATVGPALGEAEASAAHERLAQMLRHNAEEAGIGTPSSFLRTTGRDVSGLDDRLAPHEWRRLPSGTIQKVPRLLGTTDHTVVGRQPFTWAVAAAIVEWGLDEDDVERLLERLDEVDVESLRFHRAAYAAFRLGMTVHCLASADAAEQERLLEAEGCYRASLEAAIRI